LLRLPPLGGFGGGLERSPMDADLGLDLASVAAGSGALGVPPPMMRPTMVLRPTPHYAVTGAGRAPALGCDDEKTAGGGDSSWTLAKSLSIAELRLRAQQYAAVLDTR